MGFTCGVLTASASTNVQSFDLLVAESDVTIISKADRLTAQGDRAVYTRADDTMELIGHVAWKQEQPEGHEGRQEGHADRAVVVRLEKGFEATGKVAMKLPRESLGVGGFFLAATKTNAPPSPPRTGESPAAAVNSSLI